MHDSFPAGASLPASAPASESAELEHWYRRLVACYPRSFRSQNTEEIIAVLLATARDDQRRPSIAEAADLLRGAVRMRLGMSRSPWTVRTAVRLMCLAAVGELAGLITTQLSAGSIRAAVAHRFPAQVAQAVAVTNAHLFVDALLAPLIIVCWLWVAWAAGKGHDWSRAVALTVCLSYTANELVDLVERTATYAPVPVLISAAVWAIGLAATVLLLLKPSWPYYERQPVSR
jgi:hypothetical protein